MPEILVFTIPLNVAVLDDSGEPQRLSLAVVVDVPTRAVLASFLK
jgi:hypothetical protein